MPEHHQVFEPGDPGEPPVADGDPRRAPGDDGHRGHLRRERGERGHRVGVCPGLLGVGDDRGERPVEVEGEDRPAGTGEDRLQPLAPGRGRGGRNGRIGGDGVTRAVRRVPGVHGVRVAAHVFDTIRAGPTVRLSRLYACPARTPSRPYA